MAHKPQSALEYRITYGWAILIIVIVAGVLYSLGVFSPSNTASTGVTGFSGFQVTQICEPGGVVVVTVGNAPGYTVNVTNLTVDFNNAKHYILVSHRLAPEQTAQFFINNGCQSASSARYSLQVNINYTELGQAFPGPYVSAGTFFGSTSTLEGNFLDYSGNGNNASGGGAIFKPLP